MDDLGKLGELLVLLRKHGVRRFSRGDLGIDFGESEEVEELSPAIGFGVEVGEPDEDEDEAAARKAAVQTPPEKKRGRDGLTADEQIAMYGSVVDAEE